MSFGVSIGDFVALGDLARRLYKNIYKVARSAQDALGGLEKELGLLSQSINLLVEELGDPNSLLCKSGPDRIRMVNELKDDTNDTLQKLEAFAQKYDLSKMANQSKLQRGLNKLKFANELSSINPLRSKLVYHYSVMQLLLTSVGNSSLERLESENRNIATNIEEIKTIVASSSQRPAGNQPADLPLISAEEVADIQERLSLVFMDQAEVRDSWLSFGLDEWVECGKWWLMKSQLALRNANTTIDSQAYTNLLKASWILIDVIQQHPQRTFVHGSSQSSQIRALAVSVKDELREFQSAGHTVPSYSEILQNDLIIWPQVPHDPLILKSRTTEGARKLAWTTSDDSKIVFQTLADYVTVKDRALECILSILWDHKNATAALVGHQPNGNELFRAHFLYDNWTINFVTPTENYIRETPVWRDKRSFKLLFPQEISLKFITDEDAKIVIYYMIAFDYCYTLFDIVHQDVDLVVGLVSVLYLICRHWVGSLRFGSSMFEVYDEDRIKCLYSCANVFPRVEYQIREIRSISDIKKALATMENLLRDFGVQDIFRCGGFISLERKYTDMAVSIYCKRIDFNEITAALFFIFRSAFPINYLGIFKNTGLRGPFKYSAGLDLVQELYLIKSGLYHLIEWCWASLWPLTKEDSETSLAESNPFGMIHEIYDFYEEDELFLHELEHVISSLISSMRHDILAVLGEKIFRLPQELLARMKNSKVPLRGLEDFLWGESEERTLCDNVLRVLLESIIPGWTMARISILDKLDSWKSEEPGMSMIKHYYMDDSKRANLARFVENCKRLGLGVPEGFVVSGLPPEFKYPPDEYYEEKEGKFLAVG